MPPSPQRRKSLGGFSALSQRTGQQAAPWIKLRHTGENKGVGVVKWDPAEVSRFSGRSNPTEKARLLTEAMNVWFVDDVDLLADVATVRENRITNLGRMIGDPEIREEVGYLV